MTKKQNVKKIVKTAHVKTIDISYECSCNYSQADIEELAKAVGYSENDDKSPVHKK